jgi:hypothetical protein
MLPSIKDWLNVLTSPYFKGFSHRQFSVPGSTLFVLLDQQNQQSSSSVFLSQQTSE